MKYVDKTSKDGKVVKLKNYKRRARINRIKRKLLLLLLLLIILAIILLFAPFMQIRKITCKGNTQISYEEIVKLSKINIGDNIIRINKNKAIDAIINNIPYIKSVEIDRKFPSTLNIKIVECQIHAYIEQDSKYFYMDEDGKILEITDKLPENKVPSLTGVGIKNAIVNETADLKNPEQLECYKLIVNTLENSRFRAMVTDIDVTDTNKTSFTVNKTLKIILGDTQDLDYKINHKAAEAYNSTELTMTEMDLRFKDQAVIKSK